MLGLLIKNKIKKLDIKGLENHYVNQHINLSARQEKDTCKLVELGVNLLTENVCLVFCLSNKIQTGM